MVKSLLKSLFRFFASTGLSVVLLLFLMLLTFLGTLAQVEHGLYEVQKQYFGSLVVVHHLFGIVPVPLPGAYLLLLLVFVNVLCGGVVRARKGWKQVGVLIGHLGVLILLAGAFVTFRYGVEGNVTLYEGEKADTFQSDKEWELAVTGPSQNGSSVQYIVPESDLLRTGSFEFFSDKLPFDLMVTSYSRNPGSKGMSNVPKAHITLKEKASSTAHEITLSGMSEAATGVDIGSEKWAVGFQPRTWPLPFAVQLDKFTRELHPGTSMASAYRSDVTKIDGNSRQPVRIAMNEPLRDKGFTLYQSSYGPTNAGPNDPMYSVLAVVRNPAEQAPLYATCIMGLGLLIHFAMKLCFYLAATHKARP